MTQERIQSDTEEQVAVPQHKSTIAPQQAQPTSKLGSVRVVHGSNDYYISEGSSVGTIRKKMRDALSLPGDVPAYVGGQLVDDDFVMVSGMNLEFSKEAGTKGKFRKPKFSIEDLEDYEPEIFEIMMGVLMEYAIEMYQTDVSVRGVGLEALFESLIDMVDQGMLRLHFNEDEDYWSLLRYEEEVGDYVAM